MAESKEAKPKEPPEDETDLENIRSILNAKHEIVLTVRLESCHPGRRRYLVVISAHAPHDGLERLASVVDQVEAEDMVATYNKDLEYCLLGIDRGPSTEDPTQPQPKLTLGFVVKMLWGTKISLDGDGGFSIHQLGQHYIFKPVSMQALWTAIQTLHSVSQQLKPKRNSLGDVDWDWVKPYLQAINSPQSCINEWNAMPDLLVRRPPTPGEITFMTDDESNKELKKSLIKSKLREIMKTVDLDEITSKSIRAQLERDMDQNLEEFKSFIDEEILLILGQMDPASKIFDFLYLGSEWNSGNLEELNGNCITHILNVTREIDNFFPAGFQYLNIREYDEETTDLLKYWNKTFNFINDAKEAGGKVLVHCKMGISRSASTVCAFAMKYFKWNLDETLEYVKARRSIVNPNSGFRHQLGVYEGILEASRHRNTYRKLHRSKSESNIKFSVEEEKSRKTSAFSPRPKSLVERVKHKFLTVPSLDKSLLEAPEGGSRPKSWSPPSKLANYLLAAAGNKDQAVACHTIKGCDTARGKEDPQEPIVCHCYSQLAHYYAHNLQHPPNVHDKCEEYQKKISLDNGANSAGKGVPRKPLGVLHRLKNITGKTKKGGPQKVEFQDSAKGSEAKKLCRTVKCPAKTHIKQCTCNFELELKVSEEPVDVTENEHSLETDVILKNLGNFPIHIRQSQQWNNSSTATSSPDDVPLAIHDTSRHLDAPCDEVIMSDNSVIRLVDDKNMTRSDNSVIHLVDTKNILLLDEDCVGVLKEELSVKTLADMFDYRIGDLPSKPPRTNNTVHKLVDAKIDTIARKLTNAGDYSEC